MPSSSQVRRARAPAPSLIDGWRSLPVALRVLRAFLGVTFLYAGIQKLLDGNFLHAGSPGYIGTQLSSFASGSPLAPLLHVAARSPVLTGVGIALVEIAVGLGTLIGIGLVAAAATGLALNVVLFLSATWHVHPYFLGSDSIYAVAWAVLLVGILEVRQREQRARMATKAGRRVRQGELERREFLRAGALGAATLFIGGVAKSFAGPPTKGGAARGLANAGSSAASPAAAQGTEIASLSDLPVGGAIGFTDPQAGPAVLVRLGQKQVAAYSRICTHAGCEVDYDPSAELLVCPCHGAEFDPAHGAAVVTGPAPAPLPGIRVVIDPASGRVVLPS